MKYYHVYLDSVYDGVNGILHEGNNRAECNVMIKAFEKAGVRVGLEELEQDRYGLSDEMIYHLQNQLIEVFVEHNSGSDCLYDMIGDGFTGITEYDLEELVGQCEQSLEYMDDDSKEYVKIYQANKAVETEVLA